MKINSILKKENIKVIKKLTILETNKIANSIANKLLKSFPGHNLNKSDLFSSLSRLNMYIAEMPKSCSAKYLFKNQSIYFNNEKNIENIAIHECIHFLQEKLDSYGNISKLGLADFSKKQNNIAINEAAVQYMTEIANYSPIDTVKYFNISISTISPNYYPLQVTLLNQMTYFTGTYSLYNSTLFANNNFKNVFIGKSDETTYNEICNNINSIMILEENVFNLRNELEDIRTGSIPKVKSLNKSIESSKKEIEYLFFRTQNLIIKNCFLKEFNFVKNIEEIQRLKNRLYSFKTYLGTNEKYTFYEAFSDNLVAKLNEKKAYILKHGADLFYETIIPELSLADASVYSNSAFFKKFILKIKKIFTKHQQTNTIKF